MIRSIKDQNYPEGLVDIFVIADNCTDQTAKVAANAGAIVKERFALFKEVEWKPIAQTVVKSVDEVRQ